MEDEARRRVIDMLWAERCKNIDILLACVCNECGGASVSNCECRRKEFNPPEEEIQAIMDELLKTFLKK